MLYNYSSFTDNSHSSFTHRHMVDFLNVHMYLWVFISLICFFFPLLRHFEMYLTFARSIQPLTDESIFPISPPAGTINGITKFCLVTQSWIYNKEHMKGSQETSLPPGTYAAHHYKNYSIFIWRSKQAFFKKQPKN